MPTLSRRSFAKTMLLLAAPGLSRNVWAQQRRIKLDALYSYLPQFQNSAVAGPGEMSYLVEFGGGPKRTQALINTAVKVVADSRFDVSALKADDSTGLAEAGLDQFGKFLKKALWTAVANVEGANELEQWERDWLLAEAICEWVKRNVIYDYALVERLEKSGDSRESINRTDPKVILSMGQPAGDCWAISALTRNIARACGLTCDLVNGHYRGHDESAPPFAIRNHSVVCFKIGGLEVPADVTSTVTRFHQRNSMIRDVANRKVGSQFVLPRDTGAWILFLASFNSEVNLRKTETISGDVQNVHLKCRYSYADWSRLNTSSLKAIDTAFIEWEREGRPL